MALPLLCLEAARSPRLIAPTFSFPDFISPPFSTHPANPSLPSAPPPADFLLFSMDLRHPSSRIILVVFFTSPSIPLIILVSLSHHRLLFFPFSAILVSYYLNFLCVIFYSLINFFLYSPRLHYILFFILASLFSLPYSFYSLLSPPSFPIVTPHSHQSPSPPLYCTSSSYFNSLPPLCSHLSFLSLIPFLALSLLSLFPFLILHFHASFSSLPRFTFLFPLYQFVSLLPLSLISVF